MKHFEVTPARGTRCDGHPIQGRAATRTIRFESGATLDVCDECACNLRAELPEFPPKTDRKPPETGEGKGPDFRPLPVIPPRVQP